MPRRAARPLHAGFILVMAVFAVLPRTLFHACERPDAHVIGHVEGTAVHADGHCAICEAQAPVGEGPSPFVLRADQVVLATLNEDVLLCERIPQVTGHAPRGPPAQA